MLENSEEEKTQEKTVLVEECSKDNEEMKRQENPNMPVGYAGYRHPQ